MEPDIRRRQTLYSAVATALVAILGACVGGGDDAASDGDGATATATATADVITSSDGKATLLVPPSALPAGVEPQDLKIQSVTNDLAVLSEGSGILGTYELQPDGLQLLTPITLTVEIPVEDAPGDIVAIHTWGDEAEIITELTIERAPEADTLTASMQIGHFSLVVVVHIPSPFQPEISVPSDDVAFGETFEVQAVVKRTVGPEDVISTMTLPTMTVTFWVGDSPWLLEGTMNVGGSAVPHTIENIPPSTSVSGPTFTLPPMTLECVSAGDARARYFGTVTFPQEGEIVTTDGRVISAHPTMHPVFFTVSADPVTCVMPQINARLNAPLTTYTISPAVPSATSYSWSGNSCGVVADAAASDGAWIWDHGTEDCNTEHDNDGHPEATITLLMAGTFPISGEQYLLKCTYVGAEFGFGPRCVLEN